MGFLSGWVIYGEFEAASETASVRLEVHEGQYGFINPLLECDIGGVYIRGALAGFREKVEDEIWRKVGEGKAGIVSVYFRDLNNGPWFGINEKEPFIQGSLLKVPVMMGYLKMAEFDPYILKLKIAYEEERFPGAVQFVKPVDAMQPGRKYTVEELIYRMIMHSDNEAAWLLRSRESEEIYRKTYSDLQIPVPEAGETYAVSVKKYAAFFRILFNASYLDKGMSNRALEILSMSAFRDGLAAGVPEGVPVAHKFGETQMEGKKQFHDCGIVYHPLHPYLLCVMSRGDRYEDLIGTVRDISSLVYTEVDRQSGGMRGDSASLN
jgi:beta-lactamase class A